jgi:dihydrofolate synthase / folylpolyglutamate synthase
MSADALIDKMSAIHPKGYDLSLDRIRALLERLGDPHLRIPPVIHVAGTNGKGSTIAFCRAMLEAEGKLVHVHTSPHLVNWHERFRIADTGGGKLVNDAVLENAIARTFEANRGDSITIFEILTAAMFLLFSENEADYALLEVGLGGRFDATNVIAQPLITIITNISLDHQAQLGDREELIAKEKAGIIKNNCPVIIGPQSDVVRAVLEEVALCRDAPVIAAGQDFTFFEQGGRFIYQDGNCLLDLPLPRMRGAHQLANAATAIAALRNSAIGISENAIDAAMGNACWPGRMERLHSGKLYEPVNPCVEIWIDGGHNPSAGLAIASALADLDERAPMPVFLICAMLTTKEPEPFFHAFAGITEHVFTVPVPGSESGYTARELADAARRAGLSASACLSVPEALDAVSGLLEDQEPARILICGSLYLVGDVLRQNGTPPV